MVLVKMKAVDLKFFDSCSLKITLLSETNKMKIFLKSIIFLGLVAVTTQEIVRKNSCDCNKCKAVENSNNLVGGKTFRHLDKQGCNFCEQRKEMLRLENEKLQQLQKCPFEILGSPPLKGKTSEEIFDEFRELIVPSQNGFFDLMRGIVKTMHISSETELKWAMEREYKALAKEKKESQLQKPTEGVILVKATHDRAEMTDKGTVKKEEVQETHLYKRFTKKANITSETPEITEEYILDYTT